MTTTKKKSFGFLINRRRIHARIWQTDKMIVLHTVSIQGRILFLLRAKCYKIYGIPTVAEVTIYRVQDLCNLKWSWSSLNPDNGQFLLIPYQWPQLAPGPYYLDCIHFWSLSEFYKRNMKKEKEIERSKVNLSRFLAPELGFAICKHQYHFIKILYIAKETVPKKDSYLMSKMSFNVSP